jgi:hypothetical protein
MQTLMQTLNSFATTDISKEPPHVKAFVISAM